MSNEPGERQRRPQLYLRMLIGAFVGVPAFAMLGTLLGCVVLMPDSNLCGLPAHLLAIPIGAPLGAAVGAATYFGSDDRQ